MDGHPIAVLALVIAVMKAETHSHMWRSCKSTTVAAAALVSVVTAVVTALSVVSIQAQSGQRPSRPDASDQGATVFSAGTELVALNVTVSYENNAGATDLTKERFKVYEDDVEQPVALFSDEAAPASWGIVLDRSASMNEMMGDVYKAALHTIDQGTDEDETFIATFDDRVEVVSDFTADKHRLENAILGLRARGGTALWDAARLGLEHVARGRHRKKVLVVITDGEDNSSATPFRALVEAAERAEVLIYPVAMGGPMEAMKSGSMAIGRLERLLGLSPNRSSDGAPARRELEKLAEVTGGRAHFPTDIRECEDTMRAIAREVNEQYGLGYYPTNTRRDGKWRRIRVEVTPEGRATTPTARTRTGYYGPTGVRQSEDVR